MAKRFADTGSGFVTVEAWNKDIAEAARSLLQKAIDRNARDEPLIKALTDSAIRWRRQAESFRWRGPDAEGLRKYYLAKSQNAIDEAARIIAEGER
jgi:hypothetical protein